MLYSTAIFLHVLGALILFSAFGIEWFALLNLRKTDSDNSIMQWIKAFSSTRKLYPISMILILIPGFYMMGTLWGMRAWIMVAFTVFVLHGIFGSIFRGKNVKAIEEAAKKNEVSQDLKGSLTSASLFNYTKIKTALFLGIIYLMTAKPDWGVSITAVVIAFLIGIYSTSLKNFPARVKPEEA